MVFSEYTKISLDMLRIPQGLIFCIFYKNWKKFLDNNYLMLALAFDLFNIGYSEHITVL